MLYRTRTAASCTAPCLDRRRHPGPETARWRRYLYTPASRRQLLNHETLLNSIRDDEHIFGGY